MEILSKQNEVEIVRYEHQFQYKTDPDFIMKISPVFFLYFNIFQQKLLDIRYALSYIKNRRGYDSVQPRLAVPAARQGFFLPPISSIPKI